MDFRSPKISLSWYNPSKIVSVGRFSPWLPVQWSTRERTVNIVGNLLCSHLSHYCIVVICYHCIVVMCHHCIVVICYHCIVICHYYNVICHHCIVVICYHCILVICHHCIIVVICHHSVMVPESKIFMNFWCLWCGQWCG